MTSLLPARRSAERFDTLLRDSAPGAEGVDARTAELLELVGALRVVPDAAPRAEFVVSLRERLMTAAETELAPAGRDAARVDQRLTVTPRRTRGERKVAVALGAFAIVGATTSMAVAAQGALPGDALYPLKRVIENTHENLSAGNHAKGTVLLDSAHARLDELRTMTADGDADPAEVTSTLNTFSGQVDEASGLLIADYQTTGHEGSINELRNFSASSISALSGIESNVPQESEPALLQAAKTLFRADAAAAAACPACSSPGIPEVPPNLLASGTSDLDSIQQQLASADGPLAGTQVGTAGSGQTGTVRQPGGGLGGRHGPTGGTDGGGTTVPTTPTPTPPPSVPVPTGTPTGVPTPGDVVSQVGSAVSSGVGEVTGSLPGKGGKHKPKPSSGTASPTSVGEVIDGAVDNVDGVLGGILGGAGQKTGE